MRKFLTKTTVLTVVGFTAGYYIGRGYEIRLILKKVDN